ncbi:MULTISPECIES: HAD family hydrolase [unclassified Phenylobacterium]|uniref:HAD family hydrolase n=1 Tax=unclassified Phenylobacterium TaxID=2640670 RepID=UPI0022B391F3|nr:HAD-IA family hydrolase [Phenylobacterium sp. NIBR 498073]WGU40258.1 HAD-IA family hydrolase [Phenylobacterium sp. NIBR 498073]
MVDVDGVIVVHPDPAGWSTNLKRDLGLAIELLQEKFFAPNFHDIVHGRAALRERLAPVLADIAPHLTCDQLCAYWFENDSHLDHDLLDQLAAFRARGYALHLATVQEHERAAYLWNDMGLKDRFDAIHYAADLGHAKPADGFYAAIEARTGYAPSDLFFIDDKAANVLAAQARGWKAAVWTGQDRLADLIARA